jgi:hypothetical protein
VALQAPCPGGSGTEIQHKRSASRATLLDVVTYPIAGGSIAPTSGQTVLAPSPIKVNTFLMAASRSENASAVSWKLEVAQEWLHHGACFE